MADFYLQSSSRLIVYEKFEIATDFGGPGARIYLVLIESVRICVFYSDLCAYLVHWNHEQNGREWKENSI